eukprot:CAMPEP_0176251168 /NCGR_PEP_ID=MMETSP0121_2-20121125/34861_1 /TAXON_ID=160619 /ORGANISM="Kryptoperidinium foliaceum, Strain CCMP 1326" /LENGTH=441 /DNA_ID=CAMNT_0017590905 /DNA_START=41 /DNA_END=1364 /DNA_ORIENTATION=-
MRAALAPHRLGRARTLFGVGRGVVHGALAWAEHKRELACGGLRRACGMTAHNERAPANSLAARCLPTAVRCCSVVERSPGLGALALAQETEWGAQRRRSGQWAHADRQTHMCPLPTPSAPTTHNATRARVAVGATGSQTPAVLKAHGLAVRLPRSRAPLEDAAVGLEVGRGRQRGAAREPPDDAAAGGRRTAASEQGPGHAADLLGGVFAPVHHAQARVARGRRLRRARRLRHGSLQRAGEGRRVHVVEAREGLHGLACGEGRGVGVLEEHVVLADEAQAQCRRDAERRRGILGLRRALRPRPSPHGELGLGPHGRVAPPGARAPVPEQSRAKDLQQHRAHGGEDRGVEGRGDEDRRGGHVRLPLFVGRGGILGPQQQQAAQHRRGGDRRLRRRARQRGEDGEEGVGAAGGGAGLRALAADAGPLLGAQAVRRHGSDEPSP